METFVGKPHHLSLFELALAEHMATEAKHLIIFTDHTTEENIMKAIIKEANPHAALVMDAFAVGEVIAQSTPVTGNSPFPHRPHGLITVTGDVEAAIAALRPWINADATIDGENWTWADAIEESLRAKEEVNFDLFPAGVILDSVPATVTAAKAESLPAGWTEASMVDAAVCHRQKRNTHGAVDRW